MSTNQGKLIARALFRSWDGRPPPAEVSPEKIEEIIPLLIQSGSAGLVWWKLRQPKAEIPPPLNPLQKEFRAQQLSFKFRELQIKEIVRHIRSFGVEPIVAKGWAVARLYPEHGMRPLGDIDIYVRPKEHLKAQEVLNSAPGGRGEIDLHNGFVLLKDRNADSIFERSQCIDVEGIGIRVLRAEDHLRLLCLHLLAHGAWRPIWLCDVAVLLETLSDPFDWDYFMSGDKRRSDWVACVLILAAELLGAKRDDFPESLHKRVLPKWLIDSVLQQWGKVPDPQGLRTPMGFHLRHPSGLPRALWQRWPNPVEATVGTHGAFNRFPRLPFQLAECLRRTSQYFLD
ncbi:MAG: nucleotidyltransferase family protein [Acidobacteriia bacterium]|nr:nucleotidyltransferase family protein [Terriglobia bacterium]